MNERPENPASVRILTLKVWRYIRNDNISNQHRPDRWFWRCIAGAIFSVPVAATAASAVVGALAPSVVPSRTSGVAPLAVFFDATGTTSPKTSLPFHEIEYRWDFGDPAGSPVRGPNWNTGSRPGVSSRNLATGPVSAHVFESFGTYTVTLTAFDGANTVSTATTITVTDADSFFSGANTACVSGVGNFSNCPSGAQHITTSIYDNTIKNLIARTKRILFHRGETFTAAASGNAGVTIAGPGIIGAYGSSALPLPILVAGGNDGSVISQNLGSPSDWRIMDLRFQNHGRTGTIGVFRVHGTQNTILRVTMDTIGTGISFDDTGKFGAPDQLSVVDNTFNGTTIEALYLNATRYAQMGNSFHGGSNAGRPTNLSRMMGIKKGVLNNDSYAGIIGTLGSAITLRTRGDGGTYGQVVVSDNYVNAGNDFFAMNSGVTAAGDIQQDVIIERNHFITGTVTSGVALEIAALNRTSVRNNLFNVTGANSEAAIRLTSGVGVPATNVWVYNNTMVSNTTGGTSFQAVTVDSGVTGAVIRNNLAYAPNVTSGAFLVNRGTGTVASNNTANVKIAATLTANPPVSLTDWKPTCSGTTYPCTQGAGVPVWSDFFRTARPPFDLGAANRTHSRVRRLAY